MNISIKNIFIACGLLAAMSLTSCGDNEPDRSVTLDLAYTKLTYNDNGEWADALNPAVTSIDCQGISFSHSATVSEWGSYWSGFCATRVNDPKDYTADDAWLSHQFAGMDGGGIMGLGTPYLVGYWNSSEGENPENPSLKISLTKGGSFTVRSIYVNNTTYAYYAMLNGTAYSKKFGAGDWMKVSFYGVTTSGAVTGPVEYYLADMRDGKEFIEKGWIMIDLSPLSASSSLKYVYLQMSSSDSGQWGMNTPAYVAIDRIVLTPDK